MSNLLTMVGMDNRPFLQGMRKAMRLFKFGSDVHQSILHIDGEASLARIMAEHAIHMQHVVLNDTAVRVEDYVYVIPIADIDLGGEA